MGGDGTSVKPATASYNYSHTPTWSTTAKVFGAVVIPRNRKTKRDGHQEIVEDEGVTAIV